MGKLHDRLEKGGYTGADLERLMVRLVFCMFADDTGIWEPDLFLEYIRDRTKEDGTDLGPLLIQLFDVLNTDEDDRSDDLPAELKEFRYINGRLFADSIRFPNFDSLMREALLDACRMNWSKVTPAIFGSLFQSVRGETEERRAMGSHYTEETNIDKLIESLFLRDLRAELAAAKSLKTTKLRKERLTAFLSKLRSLTFFDPACGAGSFLIQAYRELRMLEIEALHVLLEDGDQAVLALEESMRVNVDQFYGIELDPWPAHIAETAMVMMDHLMNRHASDRFGKTMERIPLTTISQIAIGDALELDWNDVLPAEECDYVLGNPPFLGSKVQSAEQRAQVRRIAALGGTGGTLDYVTAWFIKAGQYIRPGKGRLAFVATNSITQGEQVGQLWPILYDRCRLEIFFAHRTFVWKSPLTHAANVHVVIVGLCKEQDAPDRRALFHYDNPKEDKASRIEHSEISPYLVDGAQLNDHHLTVDERREPLGRVPKMSVGCQPVDGGNFILSADDRRHLIAWERNAADFIKPFIGARELLHGEERYILHLEHVGMGTLSRMPQVQERIKAVKKFRSESSRAQTKKFADYPTRFYLTVEPKSPFLVFPRHSSENRDYLPIGFHEPPTLTSDAVTIVLESTRFHFGVLSSRMHNAWLDQIGGRIKSDPRYSVGLVYNTFPWPESGEKEEAKIGELAQAVLDARAAHPDATLAQLYDPDFMPAELRKAHQKLDAAVDRLYRRDKFLSDLARVEHLLGRYEALVRPLDSRRVQRRG